MPFCFMASGTAIMFRPGAIFICVLSCCDRLIGKNIGPIKTKSRMAKNRIKPVMDSFFARKLLITERIGL